MEWAGLRGALRAVVLKSLEEGPAHGYALMSKIERDYGFRPSPGALYPLLVRLHREGLVEVREEKRGERRVRVFSLTPAGRKYLESHPEVSDRAARLASKVRLARELGLLELARNLAWLVLHSESAPQGLLEAVRERVGELNALIARARGGPR